MATDLGKVGMRARGDWTSSATYEVLDVVSYQNGLYIAKQAVPANTLPTNTTYWQVVVNGTTATDGFIMKRDHLTEAGNVFYFYTGSSKTITIAGDISGNKGIFMFSNYANAIGANANNRGIFALDTSGNVVDLSGIGGALPTAEVTPGTSLKITMPYAYSFNILFTSMPVNITVSA